MKKDELASFMMEYQDMPLRDVVFYSLRRAIMEGYLAPGERLMEIKLAGRLGVSRTPIREAIRMLSQEGLVEMTPRKGAQVAEITEKDMDDVLEVRKGLEVLAIRLACSRGTEEQLEKIIQAAACFEKAVQENDLNSLTEADVHFHDMIYEATGNDRLVQLLNNLREQMFRYRMEYLKEEEVRKSLIEEHNSLCQALRHRDEGRAVALTEEHIDGQREYMLRLLNTAKGSDSNE